MSEEMIGIIITSFISLCSLFLGIRNYFVSKPKLKVIISDPESDVYYGLVSKDNDKVMSTMVGAVDINIINNSPVDIYIKEIKLKIGKDLHRLVLKDNLNVVYDSGDVIHRVRDDDSSREAHEEFVIPNELEEYLKERPADDLQVLLKTGENGDVLAECAPFTGDYLLPEG